MINWGLNGDSQTSQELNLKSDQMDGQNFRDRARSIWTLKGETTQQLVMSWPLAFDRNVEN